MAGGYVLRETGRFSTVSRQPTIEAGVVRDVPYIFTPLLPALRTSCIIVFVCSSTWRICHVNISVHGFRHTYDSGIVVSVGALVSLIPSS